MSSSTISTFLNEDCLLHIFNYLTIQDLINVSKVSIEFKQIVWIIYRKFKIYDFTLITNDKRTNYEIGNEQAEEIISQIGYFIVKLNIQAVKFKCPNRKLLEIILNGCQHLRQLQIEGFVLKKKIFTNCFKIFTQLESLEIRNCAVSNYIVEILQESQNLCELKFYRNYKFNGQCLSAVRNIKLLSLDSCKNINSKYFKQFCENNRNLLILNIQKCEWITKENLVNLVDNCILLEQLTISNNNPNLNENDLKILAGLPHLKNLEIDFINFTSIDPLLYELTKNHNIESLNISSGPTSDNTISIVSCFNKLKILKLNDKLDLRDEHLILIGEKCPIVELDIMGCCNITNEGLISFIKVTQNTIKYLDLSACYGITNNFITSISEHLKCRKDKIKFIIGGTQIDEDFKSINNESIKLVFRNNYETSMNVDYHICDNPSDEKRFNRLMRLGLVIDDKIFSSDDSDMEEL